MFHFSLLLIVNSILILSAPKCSFSFKGSFRKGWARVEFLFHFAFCFLFVFWLVELGESLHQDLSMEELLSMHFVILTGYVSILGLGRYTSCWCSLGPDVITIARLSAELFSVGDITCSPHCPSPKPMSRLKKRYHGWRFRCSWRKTFCWKSWTQSYMDLKKGDRAFADSLLAHSKHKFG